MTFSLPVKQQGIWKCQAAETPTCLSFIKVKMQSPKEIEVVTYLIATALYREASTTFTLDLCPDFIEVVVR